MTERQYIFIIGSPRSGSTWLQLMLGAHPAVCTSLEVTLYDRYVGPMLKTWHAEVAEPDRPGLIDQWSESDFYDFLREFVQRTYRPIWATNPGASHLVDKRPGNTEYLFEIHRLLPQSRFIHILRDGRDVAASMLAASRELWFQTNTIEKAALKWREKVTQARKGTELDAQFLEVRYEDLLTSPEDTVGHIFDFCDLSISSDALNTIIEQHAFVELQRSRRAPTAGLEMPPHFYRKGKVGSWREELSPEDLQTFMRIAGDCLNDLGYVSAGGNV